MLRVIYFERYADWLDNGAENTKKKKKNYNGVNLPGARFTKLFMTELFHKI